MAIVVNTYTSEAALQTAIGGTVTTFADEATLEAGIAAATAATFVVDKGAKFTLCDSPTLADIIDILGKGAFFTVISGTP